MNKMANAPAFVEMGRLGKAVGLKGEMNLIWHGESLPQSGDALYLKDEGQFKKTFIISLRLQKDRPVIRLENVQDRTQAENLTGLTVFQAKEDLEPLAEDEAFLTDLLGSTVYLADGTFIGSLDHVEFPANQQIWVINTPEGKEILFPADPSFIDALRPEKREIVISPPPGLLEIYNA